MTTNRTMRWDEATLEEFKQKQANYKTQLPAKLPEPIRKAVKQKPFQLKQEVPKEDDEQAALAKYLNLLERRHKGFKWFHCPNGGHRDVRVAARLKSHGVKRGVPDVIILASPPKFPDAHGVAIELKRRHGGTVSDEQEDWIRHLTARGWYCKVAKGWEEARKWLMSLGF